MTKSFVQSIINSVVNSGNTTVNFVQKNATNVLSSSVVSSNVTFVPNHVLDKKTQEIMKKLLKKHSKAWKDLSDM